MREVKVVFFSETIRLAVELPFELIHAGPGLKTQSGLETCRAV